MSCKPKYVNRLESASHWKHKKHAPHESTILGTHGLTPARGHQASAGLPSPTRDLRVRAGHLALQNRVHLQVPAHVCHTERDLGREKHRIPGFLNPASHSYFALSLEADALETLQHVKVLNKVTLNKNYFFYYVYIHICIYILRHIYNMCV